jgi:hypothetical protein
MSKDGELNLRIKIGMGVESSLEETYFEMEDRKS